MPLTSSQNFIWIFITTISRFFILSHESWVSEFSNLSMNLCYYNLEIFHIITSQNIISAVLNPSGQRALPDGGNSVPSFSAGLQFAGRAHPFRFNARERRRPVRASRRALARLPAAFPCIDCGALSTCADAVSKREFTLQTSRTRRAMEAEPNGYYQAGCHGTAVGLWRCDCMFCCNSLRSDNGRALPALA